jgi:hypothetical protein
MSDRERHEQPEPPHAALEKIGADGTGPLSGSLFQMVVAQVAGLKGVEALQGFRIVESNELRDVYRIGRSAPHGCPSSSRRVTTPASHLIRKARMQHKDLVLGRCERFLGSSNAGRYWFPGSASNERRSCGCSRRLQERTRMCIDERMPSSQVLSGRLSGA